MAKAFGIITSSAEHKVAGMQDYRPIGAFSFLGRYRVIDFPLSNFSNSGIDHIQVYTTDRPRSLAAHIGEGRQYNINSKRGQIQLLFPDQSELNPVYNTNIRALRQNLDYISRQVPDYVVICPSCMVFKADYKKLLAQHVESGADISLLYHVVHHAKSGYGTCNTLTIADGKVTEIIKNLGDNDVKNIFMETFIMKKDLLIKLVEKATEVSSMFSLVDIVNYCMADLNVVGIEHVGYYAPITSLKSYFTSHMEMLSKKKMDELFTADWPIYTRTSDSCPTQYFDEAEIVNSLVSNGGLIRGSLDNCVIGRGVRIDEGAVLKNCVVLDNTHIGKDVHLENQIVDRYVTIDHANDIAGTAEAPGYVKHGDTL